MHRVYLTSYRDEGSSRQGLPILINNPLHVATYRAEVTVLNGAIDIDHASDVVMGDDGHLMRALHGRDVSEDFRIIAAVCVGDWNILNILDRLNPVLWGLGDQAVINPVVPVDEEHRCDLETPAECVQYARRDCLLRKSGLRSLRPVYVNVDRWVVKRLLN